MKLVLIIIAVWICVAVIAAYINYLFFTKINPDKNDDTESGN